MRMTTLFVAVCVLGVVTLAVSVFAQIPAFPYAASYNVGPDLFVSIFSSGDSAYINSHNEANTLNQPLSFGAKNYHFVVNGTEAARVTEGRRLYLGDDLGEHDLIGEGSFQIRALERNNQSRLIHQGSLGQNWIPFDHARGTFAFPTPPLNGDVFGSIVAVGNFTGGGHGAEIKIYAAGDWSGSSYASAIDFKTVSPGSITPITTLTLLGNNALVPTGKVGIGTLNPTRELEVNGGMRLNPTAAKPTCDIDNRGTFWVTKASSGDPDLVGICLKAADGSYAWHLVPID